MGNAQVKLSSDNDVPKQVSKKMTHIHNHIQIQ